MSNAPGKPVSFSRPKVGYFSNRPRIYPRNMVCFRHIIVNILHKGDNKDDDDDDDDDNNNNFNPRRSRRKNSVNTKAVHFYEKAWKICYTCCYTHGTFALKSISFTRMSCSSY